MKRTRILYASMAALLAGCAPQETPLSVPELPVSRVVMYQSGIGYVERTATIESDELVLRIRPDQVNDILKSLTVIDRGNGRPVSIALPVDRDTLDRLSEIPPQVREGGIRALIQAFRGAHVQIKAGSKRYEGRIVGLDEVRPYDVPTQAADPQDNRATVTLLSGTGTLHVLPLGDIQRVDLLDKSLTHGLDKSLNISLNEGDWKQIELRIQLDFAQKRELALSYLVAMPTWKPAYRLILDNEGSLGTLQGWAIISNVTGADWKDISFSLVSGQPMSFQYDLYTPQFLTRPDLTSLARQRATAPKVVTSTQAARRAPAPKPALGLARNTAKSKQAAATNSVFGAADAHTDDIVLEEAYVEDIPLRPDMAVDFEASAMAAPAEYAPIQADEMIAQFSELAAQSQLGSFDEYKLAAALSVPDGSTAMVNLIQRTLSARDARLFDRPQVWDFNALGKGWRQTKSYQTVALKNETGVALDSGPITIYRNSAVIGEGYLSRTERDATAYITFANEGRMSVSATDTVQSQDNLLESIQSNRCRITRETHITHTYQFESAIPQPTTALFQIPLFSDWTPVDFPESVVKNPQAYVFSVEVPANDAASLPVSMKRSISLNERIDSPICLDAMRDTLQHNKLAPEHTERFQQYLAAADKRDTNAQEILQLQMRRNEIQNDQRELTQTIAGLKGIKASNAETLKTQLLKRQNTNEKELANITTRLYTLQVENSEHALTLKELEKTLTYKREQTR